MYKRLKKICILSVCLFMVTGCSINKKNNEGMSNKDQSLSSSKSGSVEKDGASSEFKVTYTNINDKASRDLLVKLFDQAGISRSRQDVFFNHLDQFNSSVDKKFLSNGLESAGVKDVKYDPYQMQDQWKKKNGDFEGYNCRITSYGIFGDYIKVDGDKVIDNTDDIAIDLLSLGDDNSAAKTDKELNSFKKIFSGVKTVETKDIKKHYQILKKEWDARGIKFAKNDKASLVSVVFHSQIEKGDDKLFIGHVGIMLKSEDGIYFVEKVAFQEPYRLNKFKDKGQLKRYLMEKYDVEFDQPTSKPFVMENDSLI